MLATKGVGDRFDIFVAEVLARSIYFLSSVVHHYFKDVINPTFVTNI